MQAFLSRGAWDHDGVRDDVRDMGVEHLGGGGTLLLDDTGDGKNGVHIVGVQRQLLRHRRSDREHPGDSVRGRDDAGRGGVRGPRAAPSAALGGRPGPAGPDPLRRPGSRPARALPADPQCRGRCQGTAPVSVGVPAPGRARTARSRAALPAPPAQPEHRRDRYR
ncbi:hypothetical protein [Streptomyces sp. NPDC056491]|uniref:hypothetical protein n=1 Tax=Streptomyces sp. NPDC056491 TaxID=3345837 RepID=UPI0036C5D056